MRKQRLRQDQVSQDHTSILVLSPKLCFFWPGLHFLEGPALLSCVTVGDKRARSVPLLEGGRNPHFQPGMRASQVV